MTTQWTTWTGPELALVKLGKKLCSCRVAARLAHARPPARLIVTGFGGRSTVIVRCLPHESQPWFLMQQGESPEWLCPAVEVDAAAGRIQQVIETPPIWPPTITANTNEQTMMLPAVGLVETQHAC